MNLSLISRMKLAPNSKQFRLFLLILPPTGNLAPLPPPSLFIAEGIELPRVVRARVGDKLFKEAPRQMQSAIRPSHAAPSLVSPVWPRPDKCR